MEYLPLGLSGIVAGFIDSIAGGGGLVTLPVLTIYFGPGAYAVGTNKIVGLAGALSAFVVYARKGHMDWQRGIAFTLWVGAGSLAGSRINPLLPAATFKWLLIIASPCILWLVWRKDLWTREHKPPARRLSFTNQLIEPAIIGAGFAAGFYDGFFGPGGGTVMFLGLYFVVQLPLIGAIAASKFSNTISAGAALGVFSAGGYVHWMHGTIMAAGMLLGAIAGASLASRNAAKVVRPALAAVVILLLIKLLAN
ncbi:MAG: hypothetical protein A2583_09815 [Bdellovibrionales bacterium RIFOXYD1_FULL_53_11]|nr:MAG: hypothetical protein A2583_09815 [Bdellovibrionales bacterium RIFOXYD1_FULL_53_11]